MRTRSDSEMFSCLLLPGYHAASAATREGGAFRPPRRRHRRSTEESASAKHVTAGAAATARQEDTTRLHSNATVSRSLFLSLKMSTARFSVKDRLFHTVAVVCPPPERSPDIYREIDT